MKTVRPKLLLDAATAHASSSATQHPGTGLVPAGTGAEATVPERLPLQNTWCCVNAISPHHMAFTLTTAVAMALLKPLLPSRPTGSLRKPLSGWSAATGSSPSLSRSDIQGFWRQNAISPAASGAYEMWIQPWWKLGSIIWLLTVIIIKLSA